MINPLGLTLCSYFANALGFNTLLIQLNDTWSFSRLIAIFLCGIEKIGNLYFFFRNLHLLTFPTIYNLPCFLLKWREYEFFPRGHPRRSRVTLSCSQRTLDNVAELIKQKLDVACYLRLGQQETGLMLFICSVKKVELNKPLLENNKKSSMLQKEPQNLEPCCLQRWEQKVLAAYASSLYFACSKEKNLKFLNIRVTKDVFLGGQFNGQIFSKRKQDVHCHDHLKCVYMFHDCGRLNILYVSVLETGSKLIDSSYQSTIS